MRISDWSSDVCSSDLFADRVRQQCFDRRLVGAGDQPRLFDRKPLERGEQQYLPAERGQLDEALVRSEEHTSELQSLMRISYAVFCLQKKTKTRITTPDTKENPESRNNINKQIK